jgi:hypothetical protein
MAFQSSLALPALEQTTDPWSCQLPLVRLSRVACPMHDLLLPKVDAE